MDILSTDQMEIFYRKNIKDSSLTVYYWQYHWRNLYWVLQNWIFELALLRMTGWDRQTDKIDEARQRKTDDWKGMML